MKKTQVVIAHRKRSERFGLKNPSNDALKKAFTEALEMLVQIDSNLLESFMSTLKENILSSNPKEKIESLKTELMHINIRKNKAIDLLRDGALTRGEYDKRTFEYN